MIVTVASGKGGAGKTSIAAALVAALAPRCVGADCDVDAANGAIALGARLVEGEASDYYAGPGFRIDQAVCMACAACVEACRFDAIEAEAGAFDPGPGAILGPRGYSIVVELCERCGACLDVCPNGAIYSYEKKAGELFVSSTRYGIPLVHAELFPGEDTSGKLVRAVRERAEALAQDGATLIVDAPPGIGCPVIASLSGSDLVVVVVEASLSGVRDAGRLLELIASMRRRSIGILNKTGLNADMDKAARACLAASGVAIGGEILFDPSLRSAEEGGKAWNEVEGEAGERVRAALASVLRSIEELTKPKSARDSGKELI
ncbi:MAG: 4Fe-4S binding protein [Treponema sp.]|nr:4Fe-4S binding protein [Treponema sp.]